MVRHLITPTLLNSFAYYFGYYAEDSEADDGRTITAAEKEAAVRADFIRTLKREKSAPTPAMQAGIDFENRVQAYCNGAEDENPVVREIGGIVQCGMWQVPVRRELDNFLLYGRVDVMQRDTLYDIKRTSSYEVGKFQPSAQHRIYLYCTEMPNFDYLVTDERTLWREDYRNHSGIVQELRESLHHFTGFLRHDGEAAELFYAHWRADKAQAA